MGYFKKKNLIKLQKIMKNIKLQISLLLYICEVYLKKRIIKVFYKGYITLSKYLNKLIYINIIKLLKIVKNNIKYFIYFYYNKIKKIEYYIIKYKFKALIKFKKF